MGDEKFSGHLPWRDPRRVEKLVAEIRRCATRRWTVMEVCGGQTHAIIRYGLDQMLVGAVDLIHGPGCPVCVTDAALVDKAIALSFQPGVMVCTFGDMMRVPGTGGANATTLLDARAQGGAVRSVQAPHLALELARTHADQQVVFFAVGFETTVPATALTAVAAEAEGIGNFFLLVSHVRVPPALTALLEQPDHRIEGLLAAGHVCTIMGVEEYAVIAQAQGVPIVVTGFEPVDILLGILATIEQLEAGQARADNQYARYVQARGNASARDLMEKVYSPVDQHWRGLGSVPEGGFSLNPPYDRMDARRIATQAVKQNKPQSLETPVCCAAEVLTGKIKPPQCPHFGTRCHPAAAMGPPMVSDEGACAAYYHAGQRQCLPVM